MKTVFKALLLATAPVHALVSASADPVQAFLDEQFSKLEAGVPGKFNIAARLRYEIFDLDTPTGNLPDGSPADRDGTSFRILYGYTTPEWAGFTAMAEGETLTRVAGDPVDIHPLDASGEGTDLNQLWIRYAHEDWGSAKVGRQIYALDNQRFIGHVGWRQNIQVFDAATGVLTPVDGLTAKVFYLAEQHAVNGTHNEIEAPGVNIRYDFAESLALTGFLYDIRGEDTTNAAISNTTIGFLATGGMDLDGVVLAYSASAAVQEATDPSPLDYDATYFAADVSGKLKGFTIGAGFELFEPGFRTPLATVHKFNGYADAMLPLAGFANGAEDYYAYLGYTVPVGNGINLKLIYHWFEPERSAPGLDGGRELDWVASYKINKYFSVMAKFGHYDSDGGVGPGGLQGAFDKTMFTLDLNFLY